MAKNDFETSPESGQPVSLFLFRWGPGALDFYAYTDGDTAVTHDTITYEPLAIEQLDSVESRQDQEQDEIKLRVPLASEVPELFRIYPPTQVVTVTIREGHIPNVGDPGTWALGENFPVSWTGRVIEVTREDEAAQLVCEAGAATMLRPGLRRHYQFQCPYAVYQGRCGANKAAQEIVRTVASLSTATITLSAGWVPGGRTIQDYRKGLVEWDGSLGRHVRTILRVDGNTLILNGPTTELAASDTIYLYIGCTKFLAYCRDVHNAAPTYGGFPGIPTINPIGKNTHT